MPTNLAHALLHLRQRLQELDAFRDRRGLDLSEATFRAADAPTALPLRLGDLWPSLALPAILTFDARIPEAWAGLPLAAHLEVGGEGLLQVNGRPVGGLNPYHQEHPLTDAAEGGARLTLEVEAVPHGLSGTPNQDPKLHAARLVVPDPAVRALYGDLAAAHDAASYLHGAGKTGLAERLVDLLQEVLLDMPLPRTPSDRYLARVSRTFRANNTGAGLEGVWERPRFEAAPLELRDEVRDQLTALRQDFANSLEALKAHYPSEGALLLSGHAHIDLAWLWPLAETRRKVRRTFHTVLSLMDRYPDFTFNQGSAQHYAYIEEDDPELFARIRARVAEGRWDLVGGMWVEPDGNLPAGEAWVRQLLHGQRYFQSRFGRAARVCWLPDTFGYAANLPQLLQGAGLPYFFTTKLNWNETNPFPFDLYHWEGLDGTRVLAHSFNNPQNGYNGRINALGPSETWRNFRGKRHHDRSLFAFGYGDGGGGPSQEMLEAYARLKDFPGLPELTMGTVEGFYEGVQGEKLPVWVGEQYLEYHRGTYTTQAKTKALNRRLEHTLVEAEAAAALAWARLDLPYPSDALQNAWTVLLRNQFHDILPGSSVASVYAEAEAEMTAALASAERLREEALEHLSREVAGHGGAVETLIVWNLSLDDRPLNATLPRPETASFRLLTPEGREVGCQEGETGLHVSDDAVTVPGLGYLALSVLPGERATEGDAEALRVSDRSLENRYLRVHLADDGTLSVYDKETGREALADRGNQLWAHPDIPRIYEAWDVDLSYEEGGVELSAAEPPQLVEAGPVRGSVRVLRRFHDTEITQHYRLAKGSRRLDIATHVRWRGRRTLLRARFPLAVRAPHATFETAFGAVTRPTHRNTSWDEARFEVPAHRWADLSEAGGGVSLLNDAKYGHSVLGNTLSLTLLRAPVFPDPYADEGEHSFCYALLPHGGDWRAGTVREAYDLNAPLRAVRSATPGPSGGWPGVQRFVSVSHPALKLAAFKKSEDDPALVLRLYDAHGGHVRGDIEVAFPVEACERVSLLEEPLESLEVAGGSIAVSVAPYRVLSLKLSV